MLDVTAEEVINRFSPDRKPKEALVVCQSEPPKKTMWKPEGHTDNLTNLTPVTKESTNDAARRQNLAQRRDSKLFEKQIG